MRRKISLSHTGKKHPWQVYEKHLVKCALCSKEFRRSPSHIKDYNFCSKSCLSAWTSINRSGFNNKKNRRKVVNCEQCGNEFVARGHRLDAKQGRFCCRRCWGLWAVANMPKKNTKIELMIKQVMDDYGIRYEQQKVVENIGVVDFLINRNVIVECDGTYWHSLPKAVIRDIFKTKLYQIKGYKVFRLPEREIKQDAVGAFSRVKEYLEVHSSGLAGQVHIQS